MIDSHRDCLQHVACIATLTELLSLKTNEKHPASQLLSLANLLHTNQKKHAIRKHATTKAHLTPFSVQYCTPSSCDPLTNPFK